MMSDAAFWLGLMLKMAMTATIVVSASVVVERSGPFIGALIAALPTAAGATYIILAMEHPASFIAESAVGSIAANAAVAIFAFVYAVLAQRNGISLSLGGAFLAWFACAFLLRTVNWTPAGALILNALVFTGTIFAASRFRADRRSARKVAAGRYDLAWRAVTVAVCVVIVTTLSHSIGSFASGMFAVFPVAMGSFFIILHPRIGGPAAGSVAAHVQAPLIGLALGFLAVHYLAQPIGVWWSYAIGLAVGVCWNALLWLIHSRTLARA